MDQQNDSQAARPLTWPDHWPRMRYVLVPAFLTLWASAVVIGMWLTGASFWEAVFQGLSVAIMILVFLPFVAMALVMLLEQFWSILVLPYWLGRLLLWSLMAMARRIQGRGR